MLGYQPCSTFLMIPLSSIDITILKDAMVSVCLPSKNVDLKNGMKNSYRYSDSVKDFIEQSLGKGCFVLMLTYIFHLHMAGVC